MLNYDELAVFHQTALDLAGKHDLPDLLQAVLSRAQLLIRASGGAIGLYDPNYDEIELTVQIAELLPPAMRRRRRGQGMVGRVIETLAPLLVDDYRRSPFCDAGEGEPPAIGAAINVPLLYHDELLGVISLYAGPGDGRIFGEEDERPLTALALLAASAIYNARLRSQAERRAELDHIIAAIATRFIHVSHAEVNDAIDETLRQIGEFAGVDRSYLFRFGPDGASMSNTHEWCSPGIEPQIDFLQDIPSSSMPWSFDRFMRGLVTHVRRLEELPPEANTEREILAAQDICSVALLPLRYGAQLIGFIGFDAVRSERAWSEHDITLLKVVAEVFTLALDRARAEEELRQREREYETLAENSPDILARLSTAGTCQYLNAAGRRLAGLALADVVGRPAEEVCFCCRTDRLGDVVAGQRTISYEQQVTLADGSLHWFHMQLAPELDADGQVESILAVSRDVTPLKEAQTELLRFNRDLERRVAERTAALRASEEQLRRLIDNSLQGILLYQDGRIIFANQAMEAITGYPVQELVGVSDEELAANTHPDDRDEIVAGIAALWTGEAEQLTQQFRLRHRDGSLRWVICMSILVEHALRPAAQVVMVDISDLKRAEQEVLESKQFIERITETAPMLIYVYDVRTGRDVYFNRTTTTFLGYSVEDLAVFGDNFMAAIIHPDDLPAVHEKVAHYALLRDGEVFEQEVRARRHDGSWRWLLSRDSVSQRDAQGRPLQVVGVNIDITEIKQSELAMQEAETALRAALSRERELGELKSRFVAMASHEFRTPLAAIMANAETLLTYRQRLGEEKVDDRLKRICSQVEHLAQIIEEVLSLTGVQGGKVVAKLEQFDLDGFCRQIVDEYATRPDIRHNVCYGCSDAPLLVNADAKLLRTVVTNLVSNAIKYSPEGGSVCIGAGRRDGAVYLTVADSGIGIPERDQERLFEAFHRASNVGSLPGTGLGLSIAREFLHLMDGAITCESKVGAGTTFDVLLPAATGENAAQGDVDGVAAHDRQLPPANLALR